MAIDELTLRRMGVTNDEVDRWIRLAKVPLDVVLDEVRRLTADGVEASELVVDQYVRGYIDGRDAAQ